MSAELKNKEYKSVNIRLCGINIPTKKKLIQGLSMVFGIGPKVAMDIYTALGIDFTLRFGDLSDLDVNRIRDYIAQNIKVEGELRSEISSNIKNLIAMGCYKGTRHRKGLPVHGQRTKTNARTRKGRRKSTN